MLNKLNDAAGCVLAAGVLVLIGYQHIELTLARHNELAAGQKVVQLQLEVSALRLNAAMQKEAK